MLFSRRSHSINRFPPNAAPRPLRFTMRMLPPDGSVGSDDEGAATTQISAVDAKHQSQHQGGGAAAATVLASSASPPKTGGMWRSVGPTDYYSPQHRILVEHTVRIVFMPKAMALSPQGQAVSNRDTCFISSV